MGQISEEDIQTLFYFTNAYLLTNEEFLEPEDVKQLQAVLDRVIEQMGWSPEEVESFRD